MVPSDFKTRYFRLRSDLAGVADGGGGVAGGNGPMRRLQDMQELLALVYGAIRHDEAAVRAVDAKLKEVYGVGFEG